MIHNLNELEPATREQLRLQANKWLEALETGRDQCADLIARLEHVNAQPNP